MAESTSPVGRGTAGLLLMNGIPPSLLGTMDGSMAGESAPGAGLGETSWRGRNGQGNAGEDDMKPPDAGEGATSGGDSGGAIRFSGGGEAEVTSTASFCEGCWHVVAEPLLKLK